MFPDCTAQPYSYRVSMWFRSCCELNLLLGINFDAGAHGGGRHAGADILAFGGGGLCLVDGTDQGSIVEVFTDLSVWAGIKKIIDKINANAAA